MTGHTSAPSDPVARWWAELVDSFAGRAGKRRAERTRRAQARDEARTRRRSPRQLLTSEIDEVREASREVSLAQPVLFNRLAVAYVHGQQILRGRDEARLRSMIEQSMITAGVSLNERQSLSRGAVAALTDTAARAASTLELRESVHARVKYALGLIVGMLMMVGILFSVSVAGWQVPTLWREGTGASAGNVTGEADALRDALVAIGAGAVGACLSVLVRLHRMKTVAAGSALQAAIVRIALGMLFGLGIMCLIKGGILTGVFDDPTAQLSDGSVQGSEAQALYVSSWFFWAAVGFLAGFNERWATSLFSRDSEDTAASERAERGVA